MSTSSKDLSPELLKRSRLRSSSKDDMDMQIKNGHANKKWLILKEKIMCLNKTNYVQYGKVIISQIKLLLSSTASNNAIYANAILAMIYECSIRELITNSFPVSANLIDTLTTGCSEMEILKPLIDQHLKRLQAKLHNFTIPKGSDVGVLALLLCIFKLDQITNRDSSSIKAIIEQLIKDIGEFVEFEMTSDSCNDSFIMLLFGLIWFSLQVDQKNIDVKLIEKYVRRIIVMKKSKVTTLGNVLALDILEQMGKMKKNIELYNAIYSKHLKSSDCYLLEGVKDILTTTSYPENIDSDDISDNVFEGGDSLANGEDKLVARKLSRTESIGTAIKSMCNNNTDVSPIKEEGDNWSQSISGNKEKVNDIEEKILIPERCVTRVFGLEGAIKRQIELNSSAKIIVTKREDPVKPEISSLTAHRLITGALGIAPQMPQEKVVEEKEKLQSAKVRRQTDVKWREPQREMIISGTIESIKKAKDCIDDIITKVETVSIHLDFTVDDLLDKYDSKLKTIETLLNVYMEIEEQEDNSVNIDISGDTSSCKDAKKLIFEEIGSFRSQHGHLFIIPKEMKQLLPDRAKTSQLVNTVRRLSGGRLMYLNGPDGTCVFVSGYPYQVNRALDIFQKINIELLCSMSECTDDTMVFTCDDLCDYVEDRFDKTNSSSNVDAADWRKKQPSLMNKFHKNEGNVEPVSLISYTKEELLKISQCHLAKILPNALKLALREDPYVFEKVILAEGISLRCFDEIITSLTTPMLSGYVI